MFRTSYFTNILVSTLGGSNAVECSPVSTSKVIPSFCSQSDFRYQSKSSVYSTGNWSVLRALEGDSYKLVSQESVGNDIKFVTYCWRWQKSWFKINYLTLWHILRQIFDYREFSVGLSAIETNPMTKVWEKLHNLYNTICASHDWP